MYASHAGCADLAQREGGLKKLIGYARVSTAGESLDLQREALERAGVDWLYVDVASAVAVKRPQLKRALLRLGKGDTFVVWRLDRVGRNFRHLIEMVQDLDNRGIGFRSLDENIDTTTAMGKLMLRVSWGALAKFGRDLSQEAKARASGCQLGRKPKLDEEKRALALTLYNDQGLSVDDICRKFDISRPTFFRCVPQGSKKKPGRKPKTTTAPRLSTSQGREVDKDAPRMVDNPKQRSKTVRADSSSSYPCPASAVASPRPRDRSPDPTKREPPPGVEVPISSRLPLRRERAVLIDD